MTDGHSRPLPADAKRCAEVQSLLWEYLDGELSLDRSAAVRAHVGACAPCRARQDSARSFLRAVLGTWHTDAAPQSLRRRVAASLRDHGMLR